MDNTATNFVVLVNADHYRKKKVFLHLLKKNKAAVKNDYMIIFAR